MTVLKQLKPIVDKSIKGLVGRKFVCDPLMGAELSRTTSVVSSAYKRHGHILEAALRAALSQHDRFEVWSDPKLSISAAADSLAASYMSNPQSALAANIVHDKKGHRTLQVDMLVLDKKKKTVSSYEVKRGAGTHDAGKRRSMLRDLICTQVVLKSYADQKFKINCKSAHSFIVIYYGAESLGDSFTLTKDDLDDHFGVPVVGDIEKVNNYYRKKIESALE